MVTPVHTIGIDEEAEVAWDRMRLQRTHHLVVVEDGTLTGIVSDRDLGGPQGAPALVNRRVRDVMTWNAVTAHPSTTVREAANILRGRSIGCLPVVDRGKVKGMVTTTDLLELIGRGAERPVARTERRIMKGRGPRRKAVPAR
jgi:acetoin utilization protein AcuB